MSDEPEPGDEPAVPSPPTFLVTKEYRRFAEFADACRRDRYIGVCYGAPGVGKTLSARRYAQWDLIEPLLSGLREALGWPIPPETAACSAVVYTPTVTTTPHRMAHDLAGLSLTFTRLIDEVRDPAGDHLILATGSHVELLIVDEADRLRMPGLEQVRDVYDRANLRPGAGLGVVLIGLPEIEKRLARYPQLYSRVGFVHHFRPLSEEELRFILAHKWHEIGLTFSPDDYTDTEALAAIARITGGNFRLVQRLFSQIARLVEINRLRTITQEVVEAARESLVIGAQI
jgi:DNA transposition AAA+ family ATPase